MPSPLSSPPTEDIPVEACPFAHSRHTKDPRLGSSPLSRESSPRKRNRSLSGEEGGPELGPPPLAKLLKVAHDLSQGFRSVHTSIAQLSSMTEVVEKKRRLKKKERVMRIEMHASERYECRLCLEQAIWQFSRGKISKGTYDRAVAEVERRYLSGGLGMWCDFNKMVKEELSGGDAVAVLRQVQNSASLRLERDDAKALFLRNASNDESKAKTKTPISNDISEFQTPQESHDDRLDYDSPFADDNEENAPDDASNKELPVKKEYQDSDSDSDSEDSDSSNEELPVKKEYQDSDSDSDSEDSDASWIKPPRDTEKR